MTVQTNTLIYGEYIQDNIDMHKFKIMVRDGIGFLRYRGVITPAQSIYEWEKLKLRKNQILIILHKQE